ncbi:efflux transporter outer membrane subunit [Halioxenophilus aromaticivorans]|uniref:AdeC/AdeK/OprM family multidrug efflux complex outer membrane factor n=1 Tax=Halioxenophilus aromaticivorans TaxID=1306992 RepID=A0AAV3U672_9ALTE
MIATNKTLLTMLISAVGITGCTMQPEYQAPVLPVQSEWQGQPVPASADEQAVDQIHWQSFFNQPDLQNLIQLALQNNRDLQIAALNIQSAKARYRIERSALLPSLDATATKTATHLPQGVFMTQQGGEVTYQDYQAGLGITAWELDLFGRIRSLKGQALETFFATQANAVAVKTSLMVEVAQAYLTLCADNDLLRLAQETHANQEAAWQLVKQTFDAGVSNELELTQAETSVKSAQADLIQYQRVVRQDINALRLLLGTAVPAQTLANASLGKDWQFPAVSAGLPSDLLTRRPDIIAAEHTLKAANANIGAARAAFFPSISLTAFAGSQSSSLSGLFDDNSGAWTFTPSISLPLFTGGANKANLDVAELSKQVEVATYEKAVQTAFQEVSDALAGKATYDAELSARADFADANQRYYELAEMRFNQGVDSFLEVLDAQRNLYAARQSQVSTELAALVQKITLYKVLGGGWQNLSVQAVEEG